MNLAETLQQHQQLCDELYQLAVEENRFLKQNQRVPDASLLERKRALLARLDSSLAAIKSLQTSQPGESSGGVRTKLGDPTKAAVEKARARIMQILHLDRENEQLLLRFSLASGPRPPVAPPPPTQLQRLYERHSG